MHCIDLTSKRSKNVEWRHKTFKTIAKLQNCIDLHQNNPKFEIRRKTFKTTQNNESDQIIMHCIDLTSKRSKLLSYVAKLRKWSNYSALHRFDVKTINNVEIRRKTFKTTQNYESDQIIVHCIDFTSKRSKMLRYVAKHSKQRKPTKVIKL